MDGGRDGADAADMRQRHEEAEELLARESDALWVGAQVGERIRGRGEMAEGAGDGVDDRVAPAGEGDVRIAEFFLVRERTSPEGGLVEGGEEVVAGALGRRGELAFDVFVEPGTLAEPVLLAEDVGAPADPKLGFALRHVQQVGERAGLEGEGEAMDDLGLRPGECGPEHLLGEGLDLRDHGLRFRALEKRLGDRPVVGVGGRVDLERQLADRTDGFLRGNRHAEGRVGAIGLPVLGRLPDVGVAQDHRDRLALELVTRDRSRLPLRLEGVGWLVAEGTLSAEHALTCRLLLSRPWPPSSSAGGVLPRSRNSDDRRTACGCR